MTEAKMEKIAADMLECRTLHEVAERNGISERTLRRIREKEEFQSVLAAVRAETFERVCDAVCASAPDSVHQLIQIMKDPKAPASARVSASRSILELADRYHREAEIMERVEALEQLFERMGIDEL